jgi:hypothetical protein
MSPKMSAKLKKGGIKETRVEERRLGSDFGRARSKRKLVEEGTSKHATVERDC